MKSETLGAFGQFDPKLDLSFERKIGVSKELIWRAWTEPSLLQQWFCPLPWKTTEAEIDLKPGGAFRTTMRSPDGDEFRGTSCYLEVIPNAKLVWTSALLAGYRPAVCAMPEEGGPPEFKFTAIINLADHADGTLYRCTVCHADEAGCQQHAAMGFETGWGAALDQMIAMLKKGI